MSAKDEIVKYIMNMNGSHSIYQIFNDWIQVSAIAIQNASYMIHDDIWEKREQQYREVMGRYNSEQQELFSKMYLLLLDEFHEEISDVLGYIFMSIGSGNKLSGQFFTPFEISKLTALCNVPKDVSYDNPLIINEPSVGAGGMIIAAAWILKTRGINYQKCMKVCAQDLDWNAVYMTYLQLSLLGIDAKVMQGDTLTDVAEYPKDRVLYTPRRMGVLL